VRHWQSSNLFLIWDHKIVFYSKLNECIHTRYLNSCESSPRRAGLRLVDDRIEIFRREDFGISSATYSWLVRIFCNSLQLCESTLTILYLWKRLDICENSSSTLELHYRFAQTLVSLFRMMLVPCARDIGSRFCALWPFTWQPCRLVLCSWD